MDAPWRVELFGGLRARRGQHSIMRFSTSRVAALLARLCLPPQRTHPREELIELLWPDADWEAGRNSLRVALASLRRQMEPPGVPRGGVLIADRSAVRLNPAACRTDVAEFEAALKAAARAADAPGKREALDFALSLFGGELLPGFYNDWIVEKREQLNALWADACAQRDALPPPDALAAPLLGTKEPPAPALRPAAWPLAAPPLRGFPLSFTRFFGRERDCAEAAALLQDPQTRLVTLAGPGGAGKTRLAAEVARVAAPHFRGPVCWVSLADLADAALIPDAIAQALGLPPAQDAQPLDKITAALADQPPALLVLDNFEHLVDGGAPGLFSLLSRVPHLSCLATSRRRLGLPGEREYSVAPLPLPHAQDSLEQIAGNAGVQIFVDRAQAARPDFQLSPSNAASVAELCRALEGIPLALELAAARALALSPAQMTQRLTQRIDLSAGKRADQSGRHGSLRAAIAWSYELIPPPLQHFFSALAVFRGGCTPEAAAEVCGEPHALECLTQLRERSLIVVEDSTSGARFRLLETLREYALERLREAGDEEAARARHCGFFLAVAEQAAPKIAGLDGAAWLARLGPERDNLRGALDWCAAEPSAAETGLRLAAALGRFWQGGGELVEGRARLATALGHAEAQAETAARAWALRWEGVLALYQGDYAGAQAGCGEALALFDKLGEGRGSGWATLVLGSVAANQGLAHTARPLFEQALALFRACDDKLGIGGALNNLGSLLMGQGELAAAKPFHEEALALLQAAGNKPASAIMLTNLGTRAYYEGDLREARQRLEAALALRTETGSRGDQSGYALVMLAATALREGSMAEAKAHLAEGLTASREAGDKASGLNLLEFASRLRLAEGQATQAAQLLGAAARLRQETGSARDTPEQAEFEACAAGIQAVLSPEAWEQAWGEGEARTWNEAVAIALAAASG